MGKAIQYACRISILMTFSLYRNETLSHIHSQICKLNMLKTNDFGCAIVFRHSKKKKSNVQR